ncbi:GTP binding ADP ribosylation factor [Trichuris trichiura]|uniref:GTP binding ADP ribosylation factor n=1 Tax=Trichuris trichiura TaxID=36087 RepID=A0A077Z9M6_TRITR|nr:GTP binding ADP ribosylation factor [Trichuris trichiura]
MEAMTHLIPLEGRPHGRSNVTFWIGPKTPTQDIDRDLKPSANGMYLKPRVMAMSAKPYRRAETINTPVVSKGASNEYIKINLKVKMAKAPTDPAKIVYDEIMKYAKNGNQNNELDWFPLDDNRESETSKSGKELGDVNPAVKLLVSDGQIIQVTNPPQLVGSMVTQRVQTSITVSTGGKNRQKRSPTLNDVWETIFKLVDGRKNKVVDGESSNGPEHTHSKALDWYRGDQLVILDLPEGKTVTNFLWLAVYDHDRQVPVATALIPNGPSFAVPEPQKLAGFRPAHKAYQAYSDALELVNHKIIRVHNFSCPQCPPGTWIMAGKGSFPNLTGHILPIFLNNGTYDCEYLPAKVMNAFLTLHLPDAVTVMDITWISAYNVPQKFSLGHAHILGQHDIPAHLSTNNVSCVEERKFCTFHGELIK